MLGCLISFVHPSQPLEESEENNFQIWGGVGDKVVQGLNMLSIYGSSFSLCLSSLYQLKGRIQKPKSSSAGIVPDFLNQGIWTNTSHWKPQQLCSGYALSRNGCVTNTGSWKNMGFADAVELILLMFISMFPFPMKMRHFTFSLFAFALNCSNSYLSNIIRMSRDTPCFKNEITTKEV